MLVNGKTIDFAGKSYGDIGEALANASPTRDGRGLRVELTQDEQDEFERNFGMAVGRAIVDLINSAVKESGREVSPYRWVYGIADRTLIT